MSLVGQTLTPRRKGDEPHTIIAVSGGGYVAQPASFDGAPFAIGIGELAHRFKIDATAPTPADEQAGWQALSTQAFAVSQLTRPASPGPLPEDVFAVASAQDSDGSKAKRLALAILADPVKRAGAERGDLPMHPDVHRAVRAMLDAEAAAA